MNSKPKVSIIIPVYNGSNYLKAAIDSALDQTYENIEVVVVNDGSSDDGATEKIAKSYGNKIRYYKKENGGVATALNLGIKKMTGEYFSWLSHDDLYYSDKIEAQINFLAKLRFKKVFLYSNYSILRGKLITPVVHNHEMLTRKPKYSLLRGCVNGITVMVPKTILDEMGEFDEQLRTAQDYDYWRRIEKKYDFVHMEDVLSITRLHSEQDTVVSPRVIEEGDKLWIDMIDRLTIKEKVRYEGTLYNFFLEMTKFLETTPYPGALDHSKTLLSKLEKDVAKTHFNPRVSVVIPVYNMVEQALRAIESVRNQSYKNIEIVIIDDASTDDMGALNKMAQAHKNIKLFTQKVNAGPAAARNRGINESTGEYIAFLDSDDEFLPNKLKAQLASMAKHNPIVSYTAYLKREGNYETLMCDPGLTGIVVPRIISNCAIATPTVIVRKNFLIEENLFFNEKIRIAEDTCFWLEIAKRSEILLVNEPLTIVNVDKATHSQDNTKLVVGIKNLIRYLLDDEYYSAYNNDISVLCNYFHGINNDINEKEREHLLYEGPVISIKPRGEKQPHPIGFEIKRRVKDSIIYRASRKLYRIGLSSARKVVHSKESHK